MTSSTPAEQLCLGMRRLQSLGLNRGSSGNMSTRSDGGLLITPSGVKPEALDDRSIVAMNMDGVVQNSRLQPSSEWRFHRDIYATRSDALAIVHVHSPYATALACQRLDLPPFHYMIAVAGGYDIRCAPYATFGSQALSDAALTALKQRYACLLANHGMIALGASPTAAIDLAVEVEELARQYILSREIGEPVLLNHDEMDAVIEKFKNYGSHYGRQ